MRKLVWLFFGVVLGFVGAHFVNQTPEGRRFFARVNQGMQQITEAVASGYRDGEAELEATLDDVEQALQTLAPKNEH